MGAAETLSCDVLIVGSGAAGLAAAVTAAHYGLKVVVVEKAAVFGGTSAWSGGWLWVPRNPLAREAGIEEPAEEPRRYLDSELGNRAGDPRLAAFLEYGPEMVGFFREHSAIRWIDGNRMPDFHQTPGFRTGGRSVSVEPFDGRRLGRWINKLRPPLDVVSLWGMGIAGGADMKHFFAASRSLASARHVAGRLARHAWNVAVHGRGMHLVNGNALVARLLKSALDKGVTMIDSAPARALLLEDGRVSGATIDLERGALTVKASRGVVLATGGFPHDPSLLDRLAPQAGGGSGHRSAAPRENTGDGLRLGGQVGGALTTDLVSGVALAPVSLVPRPDGSNSHFPHLVERAKPGIIAVTTDGRRFVSEADSYHDFMTALIGVTPSGAEPSCWLLADHRAQRRWGLGWSKPFPFPIRPFLRSGYLKTGRTLAALAENCGIPTDALTATVERFNGAARKGADPDFNRGASAYNRAQGDPEHGPNPSLAPLDAAPFYAVKIVAGSLGTFAGLATDPLARVLDMRGRPIPGLHAVGADMSSIMGGYYPSGGITLGPGMTFGYIVGRFLAGQPLRSAGQD